MSLLKQECGMYMYECVNVYVNVHNVLNLGFANKPKWLCESVIPVDNIRIVIVYRLQMTEWKSWTQWCTEKPGAF